MIKITNTIPKIVGIYNYNKRNDRYLKKKKKKKTKKKTKKKKKKTNKQTNVMLEIFQLLLYLANKLIYH